MESYSQVRERAPEDHGPAGGADAGAGGGRATRLAVKVLVVLAVAAGIAMRAWFLFHLTINADEAVSGLMARQFLHGHLNAFFWGQPFGGVEPYVVALLFAVAGQHSLTLLLTPVLLSVVACVLVWRVALRLVGDRSLAALAAALVWAAPLAAVYQSVYEGGYRGVTMVCGLAVLLCTLRILDGRTSSWEFVVLGLFAGIGWWALPEIVYFLIPAGLILIGAMVVGRAGRRPLWWLGRLGAGLVAFGVGALPWLWANLQSGFASLDASKFPGATSPANLGYSSRLGDFFSGALPVQTNLRRLRSGDWLIGGPGAPLLHQLVMTVLVVAVVAAILGMVALALSSRGRGSAIAVAVVVLPFVVALQPGTWYWQDGRYVVYLGTLLGLVAAVAAEQAARWVHRIRRRSVSATPTGRVLLGLLLVVSVASTLFSFHRSFPVGPANFAEGWGNPDAPSVAAAADLQHAGIRYGYADYWLAYKMDFVSDGSLGITVVPAGPPDRWAQLTAQVDAAARPAWLFSDPGELRAALDQFGTPFVESIGGLTEPALEARLRAMGVPYRVVHAGVVDAVVPAHRVTTEELGLG